MCSKWKDTTALSGSTSYPSSCRKVTEKAKLKNSNFWHIFCYYDASHDICRSHNNSCLLKLVHWSAHSNQTNSLITNPRLLFTLGENCSGPNNYPLQQYNLPYAPTNLWEAVCYCLKQKSFSKVRPVRNSQPHSFYVHVLLLLWNTQRSNKTPVFKINPPNLLIMSHFKCKTVLIPSTYNGYPEENFSV